jgi:Flp pilus assembly protein TadD
VPRASKKRPAAKPAVPRPAARPAAAPAPAGAPAALVDRRAVAAIAAGLVVAILAAYARVTANEFVDYDDGVYVFQNDAVKAGLGARSLGYAFSSGAGGNWHPLTWLSLMLDAQLWGPGPAGFHATNVALHALAALLLFGVLVRMTGAVWRSGFVAAAFALHPLHVESVAWAAERKDTLSGVFWMTTLWAYWWYARRPGVGRYLLAFASLALGLMAKPMLVTLPFVLLLLDWWPLGRLTLPSLAEARARTPAARAAGRTLGRLVAEKLPMLALVAVASAVTVLMQRRAGALTSVDAMPLGMRIENALVAYVAYLRQTVWPVGLTVFYPYDRSLPAAQAVGAAIALVGASAVVLAHGRRFPWLPVGWLWYLGTLVPVIGIVQVGNQPMADRYTYIPLIGIFIIVAWGVPLLASRGVARVAAAAAGVAVLAVWLVLARAQVARWKDSVTLYEHTLRVTRDNYVIQYNLGKALQDRKQLDAAMAHYLEAVRIAPRFGPPHNNLGVLYADQGRTDDAIVHYERAATANPNDADVHNNLGNLLSAQGRNDEADRHFTAALRLKPTPNTYSNYALHLVRSGRFVEAEEAARTAVRLDPRSAQAHNNLGTALAKQGRGAEAIREYREALRLMPGWPPAERRLAWLLATSRDDAVRDVVEALPLAEHASQRTGDRDPEMLDTLAAAQAEAGRFADAADTAARAAERADAARKPALAAEIRRRVVLYRASQPYRE